MTWIVLDLLFLLKYANTQKMFFGVNTRSANMPPECEHLDASLWCPSFEAPPLSLSESRMRKHDRKPEACSHSRTNPYGIKVEYRY